MESVWQDFRYATRMLAKNPGFTTVAVLVLALGIGANSATFTLTNSLLLRPILAENPEELVAVYSKNTERPDSYRAFSFPNFQDIRELWQLRESTLIQRFRRPDGLLLSNYGFGRRLPIVLDRVLEEPCKFRHQIRLAHRLAQIPSHIAWICSTLCAIADAVNATTGAPGSRASTIAVIRGMRRSNP